MLDFSCTAVWETFCTAVVNMLEFSSKVVISLLDFSRKEASII